jgi:hypothetical protein
VRRRDTGIKISLSYSVSLVVLVFLRFQSFVHEASEVLELCKAVVTLSKAFPWSCRVFLAGGCIFEHGRCVHSRVSCIAFVFHRAI